MSIFKEKDEYITKFFNEFNESDEDEDEELRDTEAEEGAEERLPPPKKPKLDTESSKVGELTIISLSDESSNENTEQIPEQKITCDKPPVIREPVISKRPVTRSRGRAQEVITLSSSDEDLSNPQATNVSTIQIEYDATPDLDDYDFNLKLTLAGCYKQYKTTYKTKLNVALESLISEIKAQGKNLTLCLNNETVSLEETPYSLSLTSATILKAIEIRYVPSGSGPRDPNIICIKLQDGNRKHTREFKINKHEPVVKLKELYAQEFGIDSTRVNLMFDGDMIEDHDLPTELEIEDDCVLDVIVN